MGKKKAENLCRLQCDKCSHDVTDGKYMDFESTRGERTRLCFECASKELILLPEVIRRILVELHELKQQWVGEQKRQTTESTESVEYINTIERLLPTRFKELPREYEKVALRLLRTPRDNPQLKAALERCGHTVSTNSLKGFFYRKHKEGVLRKVGHGVYVLAKELKEKRNG